MSGIITKETLIVWIQYEIEKMEKRLKTLDVESGSAKLLRSRLNAFRWLKHKLEQTFP